MKTLQRSFFAVIALFAASISLAETYTPAEFAPQDAIWVGWPTYTYVGGYNPKDAVIALIAGLAPHTTVKVQVPNANIANQAENRLQQEGFNMDNIEFQIQARDDMFIRDTGPVFRFTDSKKQLVDFQFNGWGSYGRYDQYGFSQLENNLDQLIAKSSGLEINSTWLTAEGGNQEFNGKGTMMMTWAVAKQRNPESQDALQHYIYNGSEATQKAVIEKEFKRLFNVSNIIWLEEGLYEDPLAWQTIPGPIPGTEAYSFGTGGHIDEMARFVNASTIVLAEVTEEEAANDITGIAAVTRQRLERNYQILKNARDQDGNRFTIIRMPHPESEYVLANPGDLANKWFSEFVYNDNLDAFLGGQVWISAAKSYMNFVLSNNVVVVPQYYDAGDDMAVKHRDDEVRNILQQIYPNRTIVGVNPFSINLGGGGMHCITAHEPSAPL